MRLLVDMPLSRGGIADYAHDQCNALQDLGCDVEMLCTRGFSAARQARYRLRPELVDGAGGRRAASRLVRRLQLSRSILQNAGRLARVVEAGQYRHVLTHFSEYLAPIWAPRLRRLRANGLTFGSVLHDPVRDYVVGPRAWHDWSVRQAYSFLDCVFVHGAHELPDGITAKTTIVPYGIHRFPASERDRQSVRRELGLPLDAKVLLAFGFLRDNKNLNLVLDALSKIDGLYLIVAGTDQQGGNRPASHYMAQAAQLGCSERCRWIIRYIADAEMANLFVASDLSVLTYSRSFRSASSALSAACNYRVPCIASGGQGGLESVVRRYGLGEWVEPDSATAVEDGLRRWMGIGVTPDWDRYYAENSWSENARRVVEAMSRGNTSIIASPRPAIA